MGATIPARSDDQGGAVGSAPGGRASELPAGIGREWSSPVMALRLVLGLALEGGDQFVAHLARWESAVRAAPPQPESAASVRDLQRYATLGMLMEGQARAGEMAGALLGAADDAATRVGEGIDNVLRQWPFSMVRSRVLRLRRDFEEAVDEWSALGRREEEQARLLARQAMVGIVDEVLAELAKSPEVRELIEQQSVGVAETAVEGVRERTAAADALVERLVHNVLRRHGGATEAARSDGSSVQPSPDRAG